jgi:hypothetical protein
MPENARTSSKTTTWIIIGVVAIVILLFLGFLPLPGQKDNVTPHVQPSPPGTQPAAELPQTTSGATGASPGSATDNVSSHTGNSATPQPDASPKVESPAK